MDKNKVDEYLNESLLVAKKQIEMIDEFMVIAEQITNKMKNGGTIFFCGKWWLRSGLSTPGSRIDWKI